jgi:hypothetical protein
MAEKRRTVLKERTTELEQLGWEGEVTVAPLKVFCYKPSVDRLRELLVLPQEGVRLPKLKRDRVRAFEKAVLGAPLSLRIRLAPTAMEQLRPYSRGKFLLERCVIPRIELHIAKDGRQALKITEGVDSKADLDRSAVDLPPKTPSSTNLESGFLPLEHAEASSLAVDGMCSPWALTAASNGEACCSVPDAGVAPTVAMLRGSCVPNGTVDVLRGEERTAVEPPSNGIFWEHDGQVTIVPSPPVYMNGNGHGEFDAEGHRRTSKTSKAEAPPKAVETQEELPPGRSAGIPWDVSMSFWTSEDLVARIPWKTNATFLERENSV